MKALHLWAVAALVAHASTAGAEQTCAASSKPDAPAFLQDSAKLDDVWLKNKDAVLAGANAHSSIAAQWYFISKHCGALTRGEVRRFNAIPAPAVLIYDHLSRQWSPAGGLGADRFDKDVNGIPTIHLRHGERLVVVVENTNPMLYEVSAGEITIEKVGPIADLGKVSAMIGGILQQAVVLTRPSHVSTVAPQNQSTQAVGGNDTTPHLGTFKARVDNLTALRNALFRWKTTVDVTAEAVAASGESVQLLERSDSSGFDWGSDFSLGEVVSQLQTLRATLSSARYMSCPAFTALAALTPAATIEAVRALTASLQESIAVHEACRNFAGDLTRIQLQLNAALRAAADAAATDSGATDPPKKGKKVAPAEPSPATQIVTAAVNRVIYDYLELIVAEKSAKAYIAVADTAVREGVAVEEQTAELDALHRRALRSMRDVPDADGYFDGKRFANWMIVPGEVMLAWDDKQTHPITIAESAPLGRTYFLTRAASITTQYKVASITSSRWVVSVALTYTSLTSPKFTKADDPANAGKSIIQSAGSDTRAGGLAMLASYSFWGGALSDGGSKGGIEFGAGLDTKSPALFLGASYAVTSALHFGAGLTGQWVNALDGKQIGSPIGSGDIPTKNAPAIGGYASFSFNLGSIKLFSDK